MSWSSLTWFEWETLKAFSWERLYFLYAIPFVPLIFLFRWLFVARFRRKLPVALPAQRLHWHPVSLLRFIPNILMGLALILVLVAMARPQRVQQRIFSTSEGIDITLLLDVSESMQAQDFKPNRLEAAKQVASQFIDGRVQDRIGLVIFAGDAFSLAPLTTDYALLRSLLSEVQPRIVRTPGTAIGSAVAVAINRMRQSNAKSKVAILISDGDNTAGSLDPQTSAQLARMYKIKLYTILVGQEGMVPVPVKGQIQYEQNTIDESTLRQLASVGGGKFYRAPNSITLADVFKEIDRLEKSKITETRFRQTEDFYTNYLRWSVVLLVVWMLIKATFISNVLED